jgi:hypothetical protein
MLVRVLCAVSPLPAISPFSSACAWHDTTRTHAHVFTLFQEAEEAKRKFEERRKAREAKKAAAAADAVK